ncbi:MAG: hypothetical protein JXR12_05120 [Neptunomonas phycophila]|uniref:hypothetical protein n=1 Tax=Neptunomonas phycophila TaxID=1572645 RepID=UPI003B8C69B6
MFEMITGALTWLLGGAFLFWIALLVLCGFTFSNVRGRSYWWASLCLGLLVFCVAFRVTEFGTYILENPLMIVAWFLGYIGIGLVVSVGKWAYVVRDSKPRLQEHRNEYKRNQEAVDADHYETFEDFMEDRIINRHSSFKVRELAGKKVVVLNTDKQPIPEWIMFWPVTILTYVLEPVFSLVSRLAKHMGHLYDTISAKMLSA